MKYAVAGTCAMLLAGAVLSSQSGEVPRACDQLARLVLPNATITQARMVPAGGLSLDAQDGDAAAFRALPAFCRVSATLTPSADSDIKVEVWMPAAGWNGKFQAVGNGGFNGTISYAAMATALRRGYATASTDTGHVGNGAAWAVGHPEKVIDFGWRAVHEMAGASTRIIASHYDRAPSRSYWTGCSAGGRQAMKAAQRFPDDFDGIIAGSPGLDWTGRALQATRVAKALESNESARLQQPERQLLHGAVVAACDARDGVTDGLIEDPQRCTVDPAVLECRASNGAACLSPAQVDTARLIYSPLVNAKTGREIAGLLPGSEPAWTDMGWSPAARATGLDQLRFVAFGDPSWDAQRFNAATDVARADEADRNTISALDPNLTPFFASGGKLLHYHGWSDPQISPGNSTQYYRRVVEALGGAANVQGSYRLFMAPGMGHCGGGEGPNTFDMLAVLERWVEQGQAPDQIPASHATSGVVDRTRPLCPYPQVARYKGTGSTDEAQNFTCAAP